MMEDLMDEIRRLKSLAVKHEKRIRALESRASTGEPLAAPSPAPAVSETTTAPVPSSNTTAPTSTSEKNDTTQETHDTNANVAKPALTEEMAPDEV